MLHDIKAREKCLGNRFKIIETVDQGGAYTRKRSDEKRTLFSGFVFDDVVGIGIIFFTLTSLPGRFCFLAKIRYNKKT